MNTGASLVAELVDDKTRVAVNAPLEWTPKSVSASMIGYGREKKMGVYDPLRDHLRKQRLSELILTFDEIERILKRMLPNSAACPQWWENATEPRHVQQHAWADAGYSAFLLKGQDKVRFTRTSGSGTREGPPRS